MTHTRATLRPALVEILLEMNEITDDQRESLVASLESDLDLALLNFDSLTTLEFCLKLETDTGAILDPDELAELHTFRQLEDALLAKQAGGAKAA